LAEPSSQRFAGSPAIDALDDEREGSSIQGGTVLTPDERVRLWSALSDAFVDNQIDYPEIVRQLAGYDCAAVKKVFFEEVAPVCHSNLQAPIQPKWTAFDSTWLADTIDSNLGSQAFQATPHA